MLTPEQIEERKNYIGGSDCAAVLGLSRWSSPLQVWAVKTGQIEPPDLSGILHVKLGNKLEDVIADLFTEETGKKLQRVNETIFHPQYPFLAANIDRRVVGEDSGFEAKSTEVWKAKEWEGEEIPQEYILQCMHYLAVTGKKYWYIGVLIGKGEFKWQKIDRDEKVISQIIEKEVAFWNTFVTPKVQPTMIRANDSDTLAQLYPNAVEGTVVELSDEINKDIENLEAMKADKKSLESQIERINNNLKAAIKENEIGDTGLYRITLKNVHRDSYTVKETDYRTLRIKKLKE